MYKKIITYFNSLKIYIKIKKYDALVYIFYILFTFFVTFFCYIVFHYKFFHFSHIYIYTLTIFLYIIFNTFRCIFLRINHHQARVLVYYQLKLLISFLTLLNLYMLMLPDMNQPYGHMTPDYILSSSFLFHY